MGKFGKSYKGPVERAYRRNVFAGSLAQIDALNEASAGAVFGVTKFADLTDAEFRQAHMGYAPRAYPAAVVTPHTDASTTKLEVMRAASTATPVDWRTKGAVTPIKNQGHCGSCWAFSVVEQLESQAFLELGHLPVLSVQQMVDCDDFSHGCQGGSPETAYDQVVIGGGMELAKDYGMGWRATRRE